MADLEGLIRNYPLGYGSLSGGNEFRPLSGRGRILRNLYRALNRDPARVLALRPAAPSHLNLRWEIDEAPALASRSLVIWRPGLPEVRIGLSSATVAQVRDQLIAAGVPLHFSTSNAVILSRSALCLVPGSGEAFRDNGDHIHAYTSPLWAWSDSVGRWLDQGKADILEMLRMLVVRQSGGMWSELWASYFGLSRKPSEADAKLNRRTEWEWRRPRSNPKAMELNIKVLLDQTVTVREPWREMMMVSSSVISGDHHLPNEAEFAYHRAQLRSRDVYDFAEAMNEAEADRPAGTLLLDPVVHPWPWLIEGGEPRISFAASPTYSNRIQDFDGHIISVNWDLSNSFYLLNPTVAMLEEFDFVSETWDGGGDIGNHLTICKGEVVVSEQWPLGHEQQHLSGRQRVEYGAGMVIGGGDPLSDYEHRLVWEPVDEWLQDIRGLPEAAPLDIPVDQGTFTSEQGVGGAIPATGAVADLGTQTELVLGVANAYDPGWTGRWDNRKWVAGYARPVVAFGFITQQLPDGLPAAAQSSATANLLARPRFAATAASTATAIGSMDSLIRLAATATATAFAMGYGAKVWLDAAVAANPSIAGSLTTQITMASAPAAAETSPPANSLDPANSDTPANGTTLVVTPGPVLTTKITMAAQANARPTAVLVSNSLLVSTAAALPNATASLTTEARVFGTAVAEPATSANLRIARRFTATLQGVVLANASLTTQPKFSSSIAAASTATATLRTGALLAARIELHPEVLSATLVGLATLAASATSRATSTAALRTGARFRANVSGLAASTAGLTATGAQTWPTSNRTWLFDPDNASFRTVDGNGRVSELREIGGNTSRRWFQTDAPQVRPTLAMVGSRRFLDIDSYGANLDGTSALLADFDNPSAASTYHLVWRSGAALPWGLVPFMGSHTGGGNGDAPASMLGLDFPDWGRTLVDWRRVLPDTRYEHWSGYPTWAVNRTYLLTWRRNSDRTADFFIDGVKQSRSGTPSPSGLTSLGTNKVQLGTWWPLSYSGPHSSGSGYIGAVLRYGVQQSDAEIANVASIKNSLYGSGGGGTSPPPATQTATLFGAADPDLTYANIGDYQSVVLGVRFRSSVAGQITALRFYKAAGQEITQMRLWADNGTLLATVNVPASAPGGWVEGALSSPVSIAANTYYRASYWANSTGYPGTDGYWTADRTSGPLTAPRSNSHGGPFYQGVFNYTQTVGQVAHLFPDAGGSDARNYWMDVRITY